MEAEARDADAFADEAGDGPIRRGDTGIRALLTLLFLVIWALVEPVLVLIALFSIVWALVTERAAPERLREFANALVAYAYRIWRYITCNEPQVPFPFSAFPSAPEPPADLGPDDAPGVREA